MFRRSTEVPKIPKPTAKENPDVEHLIKPHNAHRDARPEMVKPYQNVVWPQLNKLYGTLRVEGGWQYVVDNWANGSITTIAGSQVLVDVNLNLQSQDVRLSRWPGAINMYLCIRSFALALSTATLATSGSLDVYYIDFAGQTIPLGSIQSTDEVNLQNVNILIPTPITDAGGIFDDMGQLGVTLSSGATVGTYIWQMAISWAYLLPTMKPYEIQHVEELYDGHPGHAKINS